MADQVGVKLDGFQIDSSGGMQGSGYRNSEGVAVVAADPVYLIDPTEELQRASRILRRLAARAGGQDWSVITEKLPDDERVIGVGNERDEMVMGDCMSDVNNGVTEEDAKLISAMDPGTALLLADWLHVAGVGADALSWPNDSIGGALKIARRINAKFKEGSR